MFALLLGTQLFAQSGPEVPCSDCEQLTSLTRNVNPTTGFWYNPEQSGSGLSIEVKNRTVFGAYYGYDHEGRPVWFTFTGQLQDSNKTGVMWELDSDLLEFKDGNSLNSNYQAPTLLESEHQIHIDFNHMNHADFSVDNGPIQNIVPLSYGIEHGTYFPEKTSLSIPNLQGFWVFSFRVNTEIHPFPQFLISGFTSPLMVHLREPFQQNNEDGTSFVSFRVVELQPVPELGLFVGGVSCNTSLDENNEIQGPTCQYTTIKDGGARTYNMPIAGIGFNKLFGETEDGYTFKAFRYDYCDFNSTDITYVCEYDYGDNKQLELFSKKMVSTDKKPKKDPSTEHLTRNRKIGGQAFKSSILDFEQ